MKNTDLSELLNRYMDEANKASNAWTDAQRLFNYGINDATIRTALDNVLSKKRRPIKTVSGQTLHVNQFYIDLKVVEPSQSSAGSLRPNLVGLTELFHYRKLSDGKTLIRGRPGAGKSTVCI